MVITARRAPELAALAKDIRATGSACTDIAADALDPQAAADVVACAVAEYGRIDVALLNAGQGPDMAMDDVSVTDVSRIMALNYIPRQGPYSAAKAAARTLIDAARVELAPKGIRFTSIHPGFVATDRVNADNLPKPFQVSTERAARCVIRALEREPAQAYFPWATTALVRTLSALPASVSSVVLRSLASR
ncbi:SDR family oxidoreductase [Streptomyces sp. NL15-2K]|uniref:SDR family NAD(P)-dependent oxidoreductase n=1 Tax=Streptomyces sp. NL15-2K TaxID=376149 RepID=UPI000FF9A6A8|nr:MULTISPECIES: SDR family NAD(P)-dependent oxidoreductase [Actinomycetes]WKX06212.1 SDR family NAD(P)-dependent oxidoreductase [Kutzneria buriramensis]GCB52930.1 3-oxoacyl-[acyl-carrier protein] reductase [Streptomyces sp. NL15-2K]